MSETRRVRRESARQQAHQRVRRMLAARHKGPQEGISIRRLPFLFLQRRTLFFLIAFALAFFVAFPIVAPRGSNALRPAQSQATPLSDQSQALPPLSPTDQNTFSAPPPMQLSQERSYSAVFQTSKGSIRIELFAKEVPEAVNNFVFLSRQRFYDGLSFYNVEPDLRVEGGALHEDGTGDPGYTLPAESSPRSLDLGNVAMVGLEGSTISSQFLISLEDQPDPGPGYTVFGRVVDGLDIARQLEEGDFILSVDIIEQSH